MKIAVLGDTHFGMRSDNVYFHEHYKRFYDEVFFPYLKKHNIKILVQTGDLFDRRKFINFNTLYMVKEYFFDRLVSEGIHMYTYVGNHDIYYRNTVKVNGIELTLREYIDRHVITCFTEPETVDFDGVPIDFIPWICADNERECLAFIGSSKSQICFGHFEIQGFEMDRGHVSLEGMGRDDLAKYEMVISGHFHHRSTDGHIYYVGSPGEMTWADFDDTRGFHIFDTKTRELTFIENPHQIFHKVIYDDTNDTLESIHALDFSQFQTCQVKVVVEKKGKPELFDLFIDKLTDAKPMDISIVENFMDGTTDEDFQDQTDDTNTLIGKYIDGLDTKLDKERLKNIMREVYVDAQNYESAKDLTNDSV